MLSYSDILEIKNQYVLLQKIPRRSLFLLFFLLPSSKKIRCHMVYILCLLPFLWRQGVLWSDILIYA